MHAPLSGTVLCHGVFDLLHIGHIRHLKEAKTLGKELVVSVTSDRYVNKGTDRPRFPQHQRMEALRALGCVDHVVLNDEPTPIALIQQLKPTVYVKGPDYNGEQLPERDAVIRNGGRIHITSADRWSSSRLLNQEKFDEGTVQFLEEARAAGYLPRIIEAFEKADQLPLTFVGETIIDCYQYVRSLGKTSKEFTIATVVERSEEFEGGVVAAANHAEWKRLEILTQGHISKLRYIDSDFSRKLFEVYSAPALDLPDFHREKFQTHLGTAIANGGPIIVFDFGHGLIRQAHRQMLQHAKFLAVNAQSNAGNYGFNPVSAYPRADLICIDDPEARLAAGMQHEPADIVTRTLSMKSPGAKIIVTHGRRGCLAFAGGKLTKIPAFSLQAVDTMGAGDAFLAVAGPLAATGLPVEMAAFAGNVAGAIKVSIIGHRRHVQRQELIATIESLLK